jgi:uncharacterized membrane protein YphA (DoxX/SURF4 family)
MRNWIQVIFRREPVAYVRYVLGGVFVFASLDKILHPASFAQMIYNYQILPGAWINLTALVLPWLELLLGFLLIFGGAWLCPAVILSNVLLVAFFGALLYNLARGLDIHCGCFSTSTIGDPTQTWYVIRDSGFLMMGAYLFFRVVIRPSPVEVTHEEHGLLQGHHPLQEL